MTRRDTVINPYGRRQALMKKTLIRQIVVAVLVLAFATGCAGMSTRQQQALSGGAIGAGAGVVLGAIAGAPLTGALIGAGAGGITGALWEDIKRSTR
jgi:osmotically inducible lipoprotein OsmB